jgi:hypothetical protein
MIASGKTRTALPLVLAALVSLGLLSGCATVGGAAVGAGIGAAAGDAETGAIAGAAAGAAIDIFGR